MGTETPGGSGNGSLALPQTRAYASTELVDRIPLLTVVDPTPSTHAATVAFQGILAHHPRGRSQTPTKPTPIAATHLAGQGTPIADTKQFAGKCTRPASFHPPRCESKETHR